MSVNKNSGVLMLALVCAAAFPVRTRGEVTGMVVDSLYSTPAPLESVLVQLKGTSAQTYTDHQGRFTLAGSGISDRVPGMPTKAVRCTGSALQWESQGSTQVTIYTGHGKISARSRVPAGTHTYLLPALRDGVYIVKLETGDGPWVGRVMVVNGFKNVSVFEVGERPGQGKAGAAADTLVLVRSQLPRYAQKSVALGAAETNVTVSLSLYFPDSTTAGWQHTGISLQPYPGQVNQWTHIYTFEGSQWDNHVFEGYSFDLTVDIRDADNLTFRRCRFRVGGEGPGLQRSAVYGPGTPNTAQGLVIEDCEFTSLGDPDLLANRMDRAIALNGMKNVVIRRTYCHRMIRGIAVDGCDGVLIEDCVVGPNYNPPVDGSGNADFSLGCGQERNHATVIKSNGGASHITMRNNTLIIGECSFASSISSFYPEQNNGGPNHYITFEGNYLENHCAAGFFYCGYSPSDPNGDMPNTNFTYRLNWFSTLSINSWITDHWDDGRGPTPRSWTDNKWYDTKPTGGGYTNKYGQVVSP